MNATFNEDLPIVIAVVLFAAFFIIFANIIVDILYAADQPPGEVCRDRIPLLER